MVEHEVEIMGHRLVFRTWNWGMKQDALKRATEWKRGPGESSSPT